jgi:gluconate 2-dehydrogenase gamma chain
MLVPMGLDLVRSDSSYSRSGGPVMSADESSRRRFLRTAGQSLGVAWLGLNWPQLAAAVDAARAAVQSTASFKFNFLTPAEAADVEAVAAQIIPTDDTPGAREAGVVYFVDGALATFFSRLAVPFRAQLHEFHAACRAAHPDASGFAALSSDRQIDFLTKVERTPFFDTMHLLTLLGMFSMPFYGGNRDAVGWKLLGFEDLHAFEPPFGYYDRDYPGFANDPEPTT